MTRWDRSVRFGWKLLFWLYLAALFLFVVVKFDGSIQSLLERVDTYGEIRQKEPGYSLNLMLFATLRKQLARWPSAWAVHNLVGNILAFIPFGFLLPKAYSHFRHFWAVLAISLVMICTIEIFQYVTLLGSCDVDDVLLNMAGVCLGYLAFVLFSRRLKQ